MNLLWYFAHGDEPHTTGTTGLSTTLQNPVIAWVVVLLGAFILMLGSLWLLKRFTPWQFPAKKEGK